MFELKQKSPGCYILPRHGLMKVDGLIIASEEQLKSLDMQEPLKQVCNVACLPGIVGYSIAMPDIHWGYGFPIGGVAAMDAETGVISPGGVGYDINCGVRVALAPIAFRDIKPEHREALLKRLFALIPSGSGQGHLDGNLTLKPADYQGVVRLGAKWAVEKGCGFAKDLEHTESLGALEEADLAVVSEQAKLRGKNQLGSIGSGNHFVEIGEVQKILLPDVADAWKIKEGQTYILIHTGSRGFGHQICQDTLNEFIQLGLAKNLPDKQLVAAPIQSPSGQKYWKSMAAAANFAFNNRQLVLHAVREAFHEIFNISKEKIELLYDVCHNIAKMEMHPVEGSMKKLCVHRKGATRALGPGASELASCFQQTGQPVLVPGDLGRASYLMAGLGNPLTWCSACHGAGRMRSRIQSLNAWKGKHVVESLKELGVSVLAHSMRTVAEEMPDAYKDVDEVVDIVQKASLARKVARLKPFLVLKG